MTLDKETLGYASMVATFISVAPYYYSIARNKTKPHAFSWLIWGILTAIGFFAQLAAGAGPGAWASGSACVACMGIAVLAVFRGERNITRSDWITFLAALSAIPFWVLTKDPLGSVILISIIDMLGYYPTFRKSYLKPHEELLFTHIMGSVKYVFSILAIEKLSLATWLYPACISSANTALVLMLIVRRRQLRFIHTPQESESTKPASPA